MKEDMADVEVIRTQKWRKVVCDSPYIRFRIFSESSI